MVSPADLAGTTTAAPPSSCTPTTTMRSAYSAAVVQTFCPSRTTWSPSHRICVRMADRSLPASGSLNATAASSPLANRARYSRRCGSVPIRWMVQAAIPCEVITLRSELHRLPTYAVNSPPSRLLRPSPPYSAGTWGHSRPSPASLRRTSSGSRPARSQVAAWSPTRASAVVRRSSGGSGTGGRGQVLQPRDQRGHPLDGAEIFELEVAADDGDGVGLLQVDDKLHREHGRHQPGSEQVLVG